MRGRGILISLVLFGIIIFNLFIVSAELLNSSAGVQYDSSIVERFDNGSKTVLIGVQIKDNSGISIGGTNEEKDALMEQQYNWSINKAQEVFETLSSEEITLRGDHVMIGAFEGNITKAGFDKLINNSDVESIYDMTGAYPAGASDASEQENNSFHPNESIFENSSGEGENLIIETQEKKFSFFWILLIMILVFLIILWIVIKKVKWRTKD